MSQIYDDMCLQTFLERQHELYPDDVAGTKEEALDFLEMCMAVVCKDKKDVKNYLREVGVDTAGLDLSEMPEVLELPDGRFLVVDV